MNGNMTPEDREAVMAALDAGYRPIGYRVYRGTLIMEITERDMRAIIDDWILTRETPSGLYLCATEPGDDGIRWETLDGDDGSCPVDCWHRLRSALRWLTEPGIDIQYIHDLDRTAGGLRSVTLDGPSGGPEHCCRWIREADE